MSAITYDAERQKKARRNISIDDELDDWLSSDDVENASGLIEDLLKSYRAYRDLDQAGKFVRDKQRYERGE